LLSRSVARDPANSVRIARDMGAPSAANSAADRTDIVGVAVAASVASVIEGVASVERPTAHAKPAKGNLRFTESCADEIACHEPRHPADLARGDNSVPLPCSTGWCLFLQCSCPY
jgi:hypothetical protein